MIKIPPGGRSRKLVFFQIKINELFVRLFLIF